MPSITNIYRNFVQGVREDQNQADRIAKLEKWVEYLETLIASSSLWARDPLNGWLYPVTLTDTVGIGTAAPSTMFDVVSTDKVSSTSFTGAWVNNPNVYPAGEFHQHTITATTNLSGNYLGANTTRAVVNLTNQVAGFSYIAANYNHLYQPATSNVGNNKVAVVGSFNEVSNYANGALAVIGMYNTAKNNTTDTVFGTSPQIVGTQTSAINDGVANIQYIWGNQVNAWHRSTGTCQNLRGTYTGVYNLTAGGIVNNYNGYELASILNSGTIDNTVGFRINNLTAGVQTNAPYSIYSSDANAHFYHNGRISIGAARDTTIKALIQGTDATSANYALKAQNSALTSMFVVRNDGNVGVNENSPTTYFQITSLDKIGSQTYLSGADGTSNNTPGASFLNSTAVTAALYDGKTLANDAQSLTINLSGNTTGTFYGRDITIIQPVTSLSTNARMFGDGINVTNKAASAFFMFGNSINVSHAGTGTVSFARGGSYSINNRTTGIINSAVGTQNGINNSTTGSYSSATAMDNFITNVAGGTIGTGIVQNSVFQQIGAGTTTSIKLYSITFTNNAAGTVGDTYGFYIPNLTAGIQTNAPYSIYSIDANAHLYHNGRISIGAARDITIKALIQGTDATSANSALKLQNSAVAPLMRVANDGKIFFNMGYADAARGSVELYNNGGVNPDVFFVAKSNPNFYVRSENSLIVAGTTYTTIANANGIHFSPAIAAGGGDVSGVLMNWTNKELNFGRAVSAGQGWTIRPTTQVGDNIIAYMALRGHSAFATAVTNINGGKLILSGGNAATATGNGGDVEIDGGAKSVAGTKGLVKIQGLTYPSVDGSADYVLKTDGAGNLSFASSGSLAGKKYVAPITGLSGTILGVTHLQGADVVVQIYEAGALQTATITVNGSGDVSWSVGVALVSGKIIIV